MTRAIKIDAYPEYMLNLAMELSSGKTPVVMRNPIKKSLENMRLSFYGFRNAVKREKAEQMFPNLNRISVRLFAERDQITQRPEWVLVFEDVDQSPLAKMVNEALAAAQSQPPERFPEPSLLPVRTEEDIVQPQPTELNKQSEELITKWLKNKS